MKASKAGRRVNIYLPPKHDKIAKDIDNLSEFIQEALEQAVSIMAFDIIKKQRGIDQPAPTTEQYNRWNHDHPLDPLTAKRLGKTDNGKPPIAITGNPALDN